MKVNLILPLVFCLVGLTACNDGYLSWSPDGSTMAFIGHDGLRFSDADGKLSAVSSLAQSVVWLPDSKRVLIAGSRDVPTWKESQTYLPETKQKQSVSLAEHIKQVLEQHGSEALNDDALLKESPGFVQEGALLYLKDTEGANLKKLLGPKIAPSAQNWSLKLNTLNLLDKSTGTGSREIWHGFADIVEARISPDGKYVLFVQEKENKSELFNLEILPLDSASEPVKLVDTAARHPSWSADSRSVYFIQGLHAQDDNHKLGSLSSMAYRDESGQPLKAIAEPTRLLYLTVDQSTDICALKDGRILFTASDAHLPATEKDLSVLTNVFSFKPGDQFARKLLPPSEAHKPRTIAPLQVNPDETKIILGKSEWLPVLTIATGQVQEIKIDPAVEPAWRNADEVCFAVPVKEKSANHHDSEIVLHSMSTGKEKTISADWPVNAVDGILIKKKSKK
jgi:hypothetical protein